MNPLDQAILWYRASHLEVAKGKEEIGEIITFLVERVQRLQEQVRELRQAPRTRPLKRSAKKSEEAIRRAFSWHGMKGPQTAKPVDEKSEQLTEGLGGRDGRKRSKRQTA